MIILLLDVSCDHNFDTDGKIYDGNLIDTLNVVIKYLKNFLGAFEVKFHIKKPTFTRNIDVNLEV